MMFTEDSINNSISHVIFQGSYAYQSSGLDPLEGPVMQGNGSNSNNAINPNDNSNNNSNNNEYSFLLEQTQPQIQPQARQKRGREWSAEEIQGHYLDEVEEYQWSQTMAIRALLQQQTQQEQLQMRFDQQLQGPAGESDTSQYPQYQGQGPGSSSYPQQQSQQQHQDRPYFANLSRQQGVQHQQLSLQDANHSLLPRETDGDAFQPVQLSNVQPTLQQPRIQQQEKAQQQSHHQQPQQQQQQQQQQQHIYQRQNQRPLHQQVHEQRQTRSQQQHIYPTPLVPQRSLSSSSSNSSTGSTSLQHLHIHGMSVSPNTSSPVLLKVQPHIPRFPYFPPAIQKYSPELSPAPSEQESTQEGNPGPSSSSSVPQAASNVASRSIVDEPSSSATATTAITASKVTILKTANSPTAISNDNSGSTSSNGQHRLNNNSTGDNTPDMSSTKISLGPIPAASPSSKPFKRGSSFGPKKSIVMRVPFPARAPPPPKGVAQLEEAMNDLKVYDSCLFWSKAGAVNLKPEGNSWDDDMTIQSKDPAWVRNSVQPPIPTNQELLILPPVAKIERSIEVFYENSHLYPPFITKLIVERAKKTRSNQVSRILLNTIAGIAIRIDPDIENQHSNGPSKPAGSAQHKQQYMRYFQRAYGLLAHLEDIRSTYSTTYLQATLLLCYVYPKPQLRVELLKLMTEAAFLGLHVDASRWMPKPIVIQNRCWLFWACYMFDSIHHVIRGQLTQMDDHYLDAPFPALTELDHDDGLWTRWFMLKEINLWRIGRKVYSFFQAGLKRMDRTIEASNNNGLDSEGQDGNSQNIEDILESEYSEAELIVSLKMWQDDLPLHLQAQLQDMDRVDPRVNGRAIGLQAILSMLRILLLYPNMLAIGTKLLDSNLPKKNEYHHQYQQQILQQQHHLRRQDYLDKIMQCVQEADRLVHLASIILDRYPERARMTCLGAALDWCLRIYYKVVMEKKTPEPKETDSGKETSSADPSVVLGVSGGPVFSSRLKSRCRVQVIAVAKLLKRFQSLDHKYFFSWLTIELESLEEYQQAAQERMIRKVVEEMEKSIQVQSYLASSSYREPQSQSQPQSIQTPPINLHHQAQSSSSTMGSSSSLFSQNGGHLGMFSSPISTDVVSSSTSFDSLDQLQQQYRPKMHDLQAVIQKRQQQGIYASPVSGMTTTPSSTNSASIRTFPSTPLVMPTSNSSSSVLSSQQQQQRPVVSPGVSFIGFSQPTPTSSSLGQYTSSVSGSMSMPTSVYHFDHNTEFSGPSDVRVDSQLNPVLTQAPLYIYPQTSQPTIVPSQQQQQQLLSQPVFENQHMYFSHSASSSSGMGPLLAGSSMVSQGMQPVVLSHTSAPPFPYAESQQQEDQYQRQYSGSEAPYYG